MEVILPEVMRQKSSRSQMNIRKGKNVVWWTPLESFNGVPPNPIEPLRIHQKYWSLSGNHILRQLQDAWNMLGFYSHGTKSSFQAWMTWNIPHSSSVNGFKSCSSEVYWGLALIIISTRPLTNLLSTYIT